MSALTWTAIVSRCRREGFKGDDNVSDVVDWMRKRVDCITHNGEALEWEEVEAIGLKDRYGYDPDYKKGDGRTRNRAEHDVTIGADRHALDPTGGFKHAGQFFDEVRQTVVNHGKRPEALAKWEKAALSTYGSEGIGVDGGVAVPVEFQTRIREYTEAEGSLLPRTDRIPIGGNTVAMPVDENTDWDTAKGILPNPTAEAGTITQSKPDLKERRYVLRKESVLVPLTDELLDDAPAMGAYVTRKAGRKLDFVVGERILRGAGAGEALGVLNSDSLITVAKETNQTAATIMGTNVLKMLSRLVPQSIRNAVWLTTPEAIPELLALSIPGRDASGDPVTTWGGMLFVPSGLAIASGFALLGRPVLFSQHAAELGALGDLMLLDLSQYALVEKTGGVRSAQSMHLWFDQGVTAFRFTFRFDGAPWSESTISPRAGSNTLSPFVVLAAR